MNGKQEKWNQFKETGKVEDYLKYKESKDKESLWEDVDKWKI